MAYLPLPTKPWTATPKRGNTWRASTNALVIQVDGLVAGKGVILPVNKEEAHRALEGIMVHGMFGSAGDSVVIEEYMEGKVMSVLTFSDDGRPFVGMLFTGVMLTSSGPKVTEYNARFGDPETQALMLLSKDADLAQVLLSYTDGSLSDVTIAISSGFA